MLFDVSLQRLALEVLEREQAVYGTFDVYSTNNGDAVRQLVHVILSQRTTRADRIAAFGAMWARYGSWQAIVEADTDELAALVKPSRYPDAKAVNIQNTLRQIHEERGAYNIDFLADLPVDEAMAWLRQLPGVGAKSASLVLLFRFKMPVMPVDTHVHRVSRRVGIIGENVTAERAHTRLLEILPSDPQTLYNYHRATMTHGQQVCHFSEPDCEACPLADLCEAYQFGRV